MAARAIVPTHAEGMSVHGGQSSRREAGTGGGRPEQAEGLEGGESGGEEEFPGGDHFDSHTVSLDQSLVAVGHNDVAAAREA